MKAGYVIVALTVVLLTGGMTGASLAADESGVGQAISFSADPERALGWDYQARGPIETGSLSNIPDEAGFTFVEFGGARYRAGLDTGP